MGSFFEEKEFYGKGTSLVSPLEPALEHERSFVSLLDSSGRDVGG